MNRERRLETSTATRILRISLTSLVVVGIEWRVADPIASAHSRDLAPTPWAMLALLFPVALGVWAYEVASHDKVDLKADLLWGVLIGTLCYVGISLFGRFS